MGSLLAGSYRSRVNAYGAVMSRRRKARRRRVAGGEHRTHSENASRDSLSPSLVEAWIRFNRIEYPYAAVANRKLRFSMIEDLLGFVPPSVVRKDNLRVYLFKDGESRDLFLESFHRRFWAKAIPTGAFDGAQAEVVLDY